MPNTNRKIDFKKKTTCQNQHNENGQFAIFESYIKIPLEFEIK